MTDIYRGKKTGDGCNVLFSFFMFLTYYFSPHDFLFLSDQPVFTGTLTRCADQVSCGFRTADSGVFVTPDMSQYNFSSDKIKT